MWRFNLELPWQKSDNKIKTSYIRKIKTIYAKFVQLICSTQSCSACRILNSPSPHSLRGDIFSSSSYNINRFYSEDFENYLIQNLSDKDLIGLGLIYIESNLHLTKNIINSIIIIFKERINKNWLVLNWNTTYCYWFYY